jgi:hypothetical protein
MRDDCPLVIIRWQDSRQPSGHWRYLSALPDAKPVEVATVGWLLQDDTGVILRSHACDIGLSVRGVRC